MASSLPSVSQRALERLETLRLSRSAAAYDAVEPAAAPSPSRPRRPRAKLRGQAAPSGATTRGVGPQTATEVAAVVASMDFDEGDELSGQFWPRGKLERVKLPSINPVASRSQAVKSVTSDRYMPTPLDAMHNHTHAADPACQTSDQRRRLEERASRVNAGRWRRENLTYAFHRQPRPYMMAGSKLPLTRRTNMSEEELLRLKRMEAAPAPELFFGRGMAADDQPERMRQVQQAKRRASQLAADQLGKDPMEADEDTAADTAAEDDRADGAAEGSVDSGGSGAATRQGSRPHSPAALGLNGAPKRDHARQRRRSSAEDAADATEEGAERTTSSGGADAAAADDTAAADNDAGDDAQSEHSEGASAAEGATVAEATAGEVDDAAPGEAEGEESGEENSEESGEESGEEKSEAVTAQAADDEENTEEGNDASDAENGEGEGEGEAAEDEGEDEGEAGGDDSDSAPDNAAPGNGQAEA